ncbi:syntaxin 7 [Pelomyxa schiedti]|nr:syntaxin 7 [Pelomyxa schiedti]
MSFGDNVSGQPMMLNVPTINNTGVPVVGYGVPAVNVMPGMPPGGVGTYMYAYPVQPAVQQMDILKQLTEAVSEFVRNVVRVQELLQLVGTPRDSQETRNRLNALVSTTSDQMKAIAVSIRKLASDPSIQPTTKREQAKVIKNFMEVAETFKHLSTIASEKERMPLPPKQFSQPTAATEEREVGQENVSLMRQNQLQQIEQETDLNARILQDRHDSIQQLEAKVIEVNEIFRDLASLVQEQGHMIDNIEVNIEHGLVHTEKGVSELQKAERSTTNSRKRMCFLLAVVGAIVLILILVITLSIVTSR